MSSFNNFGRSISPSIASQAPPKNEEARRYSRSVEANFGDRLANARNLAHTDVLPAPSREQRTTAVGYIVSEVANSVRKAARVPPGISRSYRSPFGYKIPGHSISGNTTTFAQSTSSPSYPRCPQTLSFGNMPPVDTRTPPNMVAYETETEIEETFRRAATPGPNAKERLLLLGPLLVIRNTTVALRSDDREMLRTFIDKYMGESLRTVVQRDAVLPEVVYKISIPMTDTHWGKYNQLLSVFGFANGVHEMLAKGSEKFDRYTYMVDFETSKEHLEGWRVLASAGTRGIDMEMLSQELIRVWKGTWIYNGSGYAGQVEDD